MYSEEDLLPLSGLQHLSYCERRWALVHLERLWAENLFTVQGEILHEKAHSGAIESRPDALIRRILPLHSFRLGLSGQADVVEFLPASPAQSGVPLPRRKGAWVPYPIEYKRSRDKAGRLAYALQLCAQALCLEEMLSVPVPSGALFDAQSRRRVEVSFDASLRTEVERLALRMHQLRQATSTPPALFDSRCSHCSLESLCLPSATTGAKVRDYIQSNIASSLAETARAAPDRLEVNPT